MKKIIVSFLVALMFVFCAIPAFCSDYNNSGVSTILENSNGVKYIEFGVLSEDNVESAVIFEFPVLFSAGQGAVINSHVWHGETPNYNYNLVSGFIRYSGYAGNSYLCATDFMLEPMLSSSFTNSKITYIKFVQEDVYVHSYNDETGYPYRGNFGTTLNIPADATVTREANVKYSTRQAYIGENYDYSEISFSTKPLLLGVAYNAQDYVPIGFSYNELNNAGLVNTVYVYEDYIFLGKFEDGLDSRQNKFSYIENCVTTIEFNEPISTSDRLYYTDVFSPISDEYYQYYSTGENTYNLNKQFEVGSFIRDSVSSFLELEIYNNFTLGDVFWLIFGILAILAIAILLAGK